MIRHTSRFASLILAVLLPCWAAAQVPKSAITADGAAKWKSECASCHMAYPPGLLPQRSWQKLMAGLNKHFGADASLDAASLTGITEYLVKNGAEQNTSRRSSRFLQSIAPGETPLRISETSYFEREHRKVTPETWKLPKVGSKANCNVCHSDAESGEFSGRYVKVPQ